MPAGFNELKVLQVNRETSQAVSVTFDVPTELRAEYRFTPGQYLTISHVINNEEIRRAYSICSSPLIEDKVSIAVKEVEGGRMSGFLNSSLQAGSSLQVMPPNGKFVVDTSDQSKANYVLIAGGSGITPMMSIIKALRAQHGSAKVLLIYANRDKDNIIFSEELKGLESDQLKIIHFLEEGEASSRVQIGRINENALGSVLRDELGFNYPMSQYYICGPGAMMEVVKGGLSSIGVRDDNVHVEYFTAVSPKAETESIDTSEVEEEDTGIPVANGRMQVEVYGDVEEIPITNKVTILEAAQLAGLDPPYSCTVGVCTTCRAKLHKGKVLMKEREGLSDAEIEEGYILTCQAHPTTEYTEISFE